MKKPILFLAFLASWMLSIAQFPPGGGGGSGNGRPTSPAGNWGPPGTQRPQEMPVMDVPRGNSKITGVVLDSALNQPLAYVSVALLDKATKKPIDGAMTDSKGEFTLSRVAAGEYVLNLTFPGFDNQEFAVGKVEKNQTVTLSNILLIPTVRTLGEVTIEAQRNLIEEKVDRLVYNAESDLSAKGGDAADVLRKVPLLTVDLDGNVTVRGSSNIRVLINNKPSTIVASSVADALRQIPADMIKTVEVITSPSARYDAEGSGGIINIITKKNTLQGVTLNVNSGVGNRGANLGLNGNYRKGNMGITLGGFGRAFYNPSINTLRQTAFDGITTIRTEQDVDAFDRGLFGRYNLGWDLDLKNNQAITANVSYGTRGSVRTQDQVTNIFVNDVLSSTSNRDVDSKDISGTVDVNLDYIKIYKPGKEWSVSSQFSQNNLVNSFDAGLLNEAGTVLNTLRNLNENINREITFQTDYQSPISTNQMIGFGGKGIIRQVISDYKYQVADGNSNNFEQDLNRPSGLLDYNQDIAAAYLEYTYTTASKFSIKGGARYEATFIRAETRETGEFEIPNYQNLVPSLNLSQRINDRVTVRGGYNRRIQRPGLQQLNPNFNAANAQDITVGNPNLQPEITDNIELGLGASIKKTYINFSVFGRNSSNTITAVRSLADSTSGAILTTFENIGREQAFGGNAFFNLNITQKWSFNGGVDVVYSSLTGTANGIGGTQNLSNSGAVVSGRLMTNISFKNGWGAQAFGFMRGAQVQLQGRQAPFGIYSMGIKKDFKNKKGSIGISGENFFTRGLRQTNTFESPTFTQVNESLRLNRGVRMNFDYRIGKMTFVQSKRKTKSVKNDDVKSGGGGDNNGGM